MSQLEGQVLPYREELPNWDRCVAYTRAGTRCKRSVPQHPDPQQSYLVCAQHQRSCCCRWEDMAKDADTEVHAIGNGVHVVTGLVCTYCGRRWDVVP